MTVVFKESVPTLDARQLVNEQIQTVTGEIPSELGVPEMMPITTGLGEIYQYVLKVAPGYEDKYDAMELRTIQDWIVKRQLSGIPGIVEINSFGGYLKQYEVAVDPDALYSLNITISDVYDALSRNNQNTGGSYIEKVNRAYYIRLWYCGRRFHCDIGRNSGTYLRSSVDGTYPQQRRNGCRGGERSWQCRTKRHVCRFDYSDCVLPYIDFDRNRRKILYADGQDAGVLYYRCFAAVADYVPMMASLFLKRTVSVKPTLADRFFEKLNRVYRRTLDFCLSHVWGTLVSAFTLLILSFFLFTRLGAEFIPTLDEGDFAMQMTLPAGSSLSRSIEVSLEAEKKLKQDFPEIKHVVAKIGTAEVPTDPMAVEDADVMIVMKPFSEWTSASSRAEMVEKMKKSLETVEGAEFNFSQPIQLRFNELMTGARADIAIKLYGEDMTELYAKAKEAAKFVEQVPGAADVLVEQAMGLPQLLVKYDRSKIARSGTDVTETATHGSAVIGGECREAQ